MEMPGGRLEAVDLGDGRGLDSPWWVERLLASAGVNAR